MVFGVNVRLVLLQPPPPPPCPMDLPPFPHRLKNQQRFRVGPVPHTGGRDGSAGQGLRVDTTASAGGGWRRRGKAVKAVAAAGGIISMVVRKIFCSFFFARRAGSIWLLARSRHTTSYHYRHTILWSYEFLRALGYEKGR
jgi:hypothetical protein